MIKYYTNKLCPKTHVRIDKLPLQVESLVSQTISEALKEASEEDKNMRMKRPEKL